MLSSIKSRIIVFYLSVLFVSLSVLGLLLYASLHRIIYQSIDAGLLSKAKILAASIYEDKDETVPDFSDADDIMWVYNSKRARNFFQIRRLDGTTIKKSKALGDGELPFGPTAEESTFRTIVFAGEPARLVNLYTDSEQYGNGKTPSSKTRPAIVIQCAEDINEQQGLLQNYAVAMACSILAVMAISAAGGFVIARKALAPVRKISESVDRISESNLSERIAVTDTPDELQILAASFNRTLDRLERSFVRQRQFAADASHELRTPLSVIMSQSDITLRRERPAREYQEALTAIMGAAGIMSDMVRKLLFLARLNVDEVDLNRRVQLELGEVIHEAISFLEPLAFQKDIIITFNGQCNFEIMGDRAVLLELFVNIIDNSIKYGRTSGTVKVSLRQEGEFVLSEIKDNGIGIPESDLTRIFDRFYRVDKSRSRESGGAGLGLSICQAIVQQHGGRIEIQSESGIGTMVSIYLPAS